MVLDCPGAEGSEFPEYSGFFWNYATTNDMSHVRYGRHGQGPEAQQVRKYCLFGTLSVACHFILATSGAASEEPRFTPSLKQTAGGKLDPGGD